MNIHEYQAKEILKRFGIPIPRGHVVTTPDQARTVARDLGSPCVVKAQIHAGGRGKAGGIKLAGNAEEAGTKAAELLGKKLVTHQTGPQGREVRRVLVEEGLKIERELYVGIVLDRSVSRPSLIASAEGGVEIEEVAQKTPDKIFTELVDPAVGLQPFQGRRLAYRLGIHTEHVTPMVTLLLGLARAFGELDTNWPLLPE